MEQLVSPLCRGIVLITVGENKGNKLSRSKYSNLVTAIKASIVKKTNCYKLVPFNLEGTIFKVEWDEPVKIRKASPNAIAALEAYRNHKINENLNEEVEVEELDIQN